MKQFLRIYAHIDNNILRLNTHSARLPNNTENLIMHSELIKKHVNIQKKRSSLKLILKDLDVMEKHIVWAMYLNWIEDLQLNSAETFQFLELEP